MALLHIHLEVFQVLVPDPMPVVLLDSSYYFCLIFLLLNLFEIVMKMGNDLIFLSLAIFRQLKLGWSSMV